MSTSPCAGMIAAVVRSDLCQRIPVKYSSVDPDSTSRAATCCCAMSACSLAMRARRSAAEMAGSEPVMDLSSVFGRAGAASAAVATTSDAAEALHTKLRLDSMVHPLEAAAGESQAPILTQASAQRPSIRNRLLNALPRCRTAAEKPVLPAQKVGKPDLVAAERPICRRKCEAQPWYGAEPPVSRARHDQGL